MVKDPRLLAKLGIARLYLHAATIVLVLIDAVSVWLGITAMKLAWREIMITLQRLVRLPQ